MNLVSKLVAFYCSLTLTIQTNSFSSHLLAINPVALDRISPTQGARGLRKPDRARLAEARVAGKPDVVVLLACAPAANEAVAREIHSIGGSVQYRADDVDYLRARVPIDKVETVAHLDLVKAISLDGEVIYRTSADNDEKDDRTAVSERNLQERMSAPDWNTPAENPYLPSREIGAPQFIRTNPTFDGRGVTIGIIDGFPDVLSPELQTAATLDGKPTRKVADLVSAGDRVEDESPALIRMRIEVTASRTTFTEGGLSYRTPGDGSYRLGFLNERQFSYYNNDLNFDGNTPNGSGLFAVLWNERTNNVWIDTNQNQDFTDEQAMTDYGVRFEVGMFGKDRLATPLRESLPFAVQILPDTKSVRVNILGSRHATNVAGVAVGKGFFGGQMNGVAPNAQLIPISNPDNVHGLVEAFVIAARNPQIDVITCVELFHLSLNDGHSVVGIICDRLVERYRKPVFVGADNSGPGLNTIGENGAASQVISVGAYTHRNTLRAVYGRVVSREHWVDIYSARGPAENGSFKPDLVAPGISVTTNSAVFPSQGLSNMYTLPPGYRATGGTSLSAPAAAGAAALLISAARQKGVAYDAEQLGWALRASARFLPGLAAHEQGDGMINVPAAWELLKRGRPQIRISTRAQVNTKLSSYLDVSNQGSGIYEREGWTAGQTGRRTITFTRTSGPAKPERYGIEWIANDGTFASPLTIVLPFNSPVSLSVAIRPTVNGIHSAILKLVDLKSSLVVAEMMNTVVAAEQLTRNNRFSVSLEGNAEWLGYKSYFVNVPKAARALTIKGRVMNGSVDIRFLDPAGEDVKSWRPRPPGSSGGAEQISGNWNRTVASPMPGVWEVVVSYWDNRSRDAVLSSRSDASFALTATVLGVEVRSRSGDRGQTTSIELSNMFGDFDGSTVDSLLGSLFQERLSLSARGMQSIHEINVEAGTRTLVAQITNSTDREADLDLYVFDCTSNQPILRGFSAGVGSGEKITLDNPAPGKWRVVIDPFRVPSGRTKLDYQDFVSNPIYGTIDARESKAKHRVGEWWKELVTIKSGNSPPAGRSLAGLLEVISNDEVTFDSSPTLNNSRNPSESISASDVHRPVPLAMTIIDLARGSKNSVGP